MPISTRYESAEAVRNIYAVVPSSIVKPVFSFARLFATVIR